MRNIKLKGIMTAQQISQVEFIKQYLESEQPMDSNDSLYWATGYIAALVDYKVIDIVQHADILAWME